MIRTIKIALVLCLVLLASVLMFTACDISTILPTQTETTLEGTSAPEETTPPTDGHTHVWSAWITIKEPQCKEAGLTQRYCTICSYTESQPTNALGHTVVIDKAVAPTCTSTGLTEGKHCSVCYKVFVAQQIVPANGHTEVIDEAVEPTCTTNGLTEGKHCSTCGKILVRQQTISALKHTTVDGVCSRCGYVASSCDINGHDYGNRFDKKWGICVVCGYVHDNHEHSIVNGKCEYCDYEFEAIAVPSTFDNDGDGQNDVFYFSPALPEEFTSEDVIWIDAFNDAAPGGHIEYDEIRADSGSLPYPHVYCYDKDTTSTIIFTVDVEKAGLYNVAVHYRIKDYKTRGAKFVVNEGTEFEYAINHTYGWATTDDAYAVRNNDFLIGSYMTGLVLPLQEGENTITIRVADGVAKGQHFRDLYLVPVEKIPECPEHHEVIDEAVAPTCTTNGLTEGKHCFVCGEVLVAQTTVDALGHSYTSTVTPPTATEDGYTTYTCACGDTYTEAIVPTDFTIYSYNRTMVGYTNEVGENLVIPSVFEDSGTWYRVTSIGPYAFQYCYNLTSITIPNSVTNIGGDAFEHCLYLTSVTIPDSVTSIHSYAFENCFNLTAVTIPDSVTAINAGLFDGCSSLTSITIGNSVTYVDSSAFYRCSSLTSIVVEDGNSTYYSDGNCLIERESGILLVGCKTSVIPEGVTCIGRYAFYTCSNLTSITIPDSVASIDYGAFQNCSSLTNIIIPSSVTRIGALAFQNCSSLMSITFEGTVAQWNAISFGNVWNHNVPATEVVCSDGVVCFTHTEVIEEGVDPTCTTPGLTEGKHCSVCNEVLVAQEVIDALGHTEVIDAAVEATCTATGLTEGKHCSVCGQVLVTQETIPVKGHYYGAWITIKVPTESEEGLQERSCVCGEKETRTITFEIVETVIPKLSMFESIFQADSRGWCMYNDIISSTVTIVLSKQEELIAGGANRADVTLAGIATENLRVLLKGYNDLRTQKWNSDFEKYKALYQYYADNYDALEQNFCDLYKCLKGLYENTIVSTYIKSQGKADHYRQFVGLLFVVSTALDQDVYRDEDAWRMDKKTLREVIEDVHYFPDGNWYPEELQYLNA